MRQRRHRARERLNPDTSEDLNRWLISYADFVTLMFAFFVVLYGISTLKEGQYRVLSESLVEAFKSKSSQAEVTIKPQLGGGDGPLKGQTLLPIPSWWNKAEYQRQQQQHSNRKKLLEAVAPLMQDDRFVVLESTHGISIEINNEILFQAGAVTPGAEAVGTLAAIADLLIKTGLPAVVEGHTDDTPIATKRFPSNWELSAFRATSVLRLLVAAGVDRRQLTPIGYGAERPLVANASLAGKQRNRRVTILIEAMAASAAPPQ